VATPKDDRGGSNRVENPKNKTTHKPFEDIWWLGMKKLVRPTAEAIEAAISAYDCRHQQQAEDGTQFIEISEIHPFCARTQSA